MADWTIDNLAGVLNGFSLPPSTSLDNTTLSLVLQESKLLTLEKKLTRSLALLLLHDLLLQSRGIQASDAWPMKQAVMRHKARLKAEFVKAKIKVGANKDGLVEGEEERKALIFFHVQF